MDKSFWQQKWDKNEIGFHESAANPLLVNHFKSLGLNSGQRIFLPLCGKTLDIAWLLSQGCNVAGAELVEVATQQLFEELKVTPTITQLGEIKRYSAQNLDLFVGDIFKLTQDTLGTVDAIYDRAALVALPKEMRLNYSAHLRAITKNAPQLLIALEYDQSLVDGPPFSVTADEVRLHYEKNYSMKELERQFWPKGLKGKFPSTSVVWELK